MSAWIETREDIWEHHKTIRLCAALKIDEVQAVGHLISLWHFVLRNAWRDADMTKWGEMGIERACRWRGESGEMVKALRDAGFLDKNIVHGWLERAGGLVNDRLRKEQERSANVHRLSIKTLDKPREVQESPGKSGKVLDKSRTKPGLSEATEPNRTETEQNRTEQRQNRTKEKKTAIAANAAAAPQNGKTPQQQLMDWYLPRYHPGDLPGQASQRYSEFGKAVKKILAVCENNVRLAKDATNDIINFYVTDREWSRERATLHVVGRDIAAYVRHPQAYRPGYNDENGPESFDFCPKCRQGHGWRSSEPCDPKYVAMWAGKVPPVGTATGHAAEDGAAAAAEGGHGQGA